ncbi:SRPBCC family protein [Carboxydochorda subterranea]|uniref:SRPBCC family protein n=1 Tax=Carboxydichorda subterranea TaxID=3109565 RepID=A0ABZ1C1I3_9FIRM|nr:SRPBCC family protein [Limnochorda sp. L945t]WRP18725.1 SRPBCC family protein [Limnochorda sp. L945t]
MEVAHDAGRQASPGWTLITETLWAYYTTLLRQWLEMGEVGFRLDFCNADRRIIEQSSECRVSAATAFAALTDPAYLRNWIAENATVELRVGGRYSLGWGAEGTDGPGRIVRLQPGRSLGYSWFEGGRLTEVDWLVEDLGNRCRIILRHGDFTDHPHQHLGCSLGWADWINVLWLYLREFRDMRAWRGSARLRSGDGRLGPCGGHFARCARGPTGNEPRRGLRCR